MRKYFTLLGWIIALIGSSYSLYLSEFLNREPCVFCWFARVCLFSLSVLLIAPMYKGRYSVIPYLIPMSVIGITITAWQTGFFLTSRVCSVTRSCDVQGAVAGLVGFILITLFLALGPKRDNLV